MEFKHEPVLLHEVLEWLAPAPGGIFADGTLGGGGHSEQIIRRIGETGCHYGIDRDEDALTAATERLRGYTAFHAIHGNFHDVRELLPEGVMLDGGLLDLGVSSYQLDTPERGFSYHEEAPLDMRMDRSSGETAAQWLARCDERTIASALYDYGDEKWAARIAKIIKERQQKAPILTTTDLVSCVDAAIPKAVRKKDDGHPARRTFQAIRIAVNDELGSVEKVMADAVECLNPGGRLAVITFHSLEDRIVKNGMTEAAKGCTCPPNFPVCVCGKKPKVKLISRKPIVASQEELDANPRSRSAKLRVCEKL